MIQCLVLSTFSEQLQLSEYITWRCKENEQEGENRGMTAAGLIFFATNYQKKNKIFFCS